MAVITKGAAVDPVNETEFVRKTYVAAVDLVPGDLVYIDSTGKANKAAGGVAGTAVVAGVALKPASAGFGVTCMVQGSVYGFDLAAVAFGAQVFLSNTAGALDTAAGTVSFVVGRVLPVGNAEKALFVNLPAAW